VPRLARVPLVADACFMLFICGLLTVEVSCELAQCLWQVVPDLSKNYSVSSPGTRGLLKIKTVRSFETSVRALSIPQRHISGDLDLHQYRYENFKSPTVDY